MPDIKLFKVHSYADLHGFKDVPIVWFVDKRERRLFGPGGSLNVQVRDVLPNYTGSYHDYDSADALEEYFTESEAKAFGDWLQVHRRTAVTTEAVQFPIILEDNAILGAIGTTPVGGETGFLLMPAAPDYGFPFNVWGYFDVRDCEPIAKSA
ncbi:MAG: hypothetical protein WB677_05130 [Xanthobacteraceae bacterium]